jgi:6-phosphofructokinase
MRALMDRWKAVPRTGRDGDDDLWKEFRAAQDVFFAARAESDKKRTGEEQANQQQKEELLAEAEKLDPTTDLRGAQNALRKIQERYDAIGHVPRGAMRSLEDRMQAVEQKVRGATDTSRARTAPENPMVTSMRAAVTKAEEQLAKAEAAGDKRRIEEAQANLTTRREWLAEAEKSASRR